jgi:hypothetical protein
VEIAIYPGIALIVTVKKSTGVQDQASCQRFDPIYFIRFIAGLATTVTSNSLIKENISNTKKTIKKNNRAIRPRRIKTVRNSRLVEEVTG